MEWQFALSFRVMQSQGKIVISASANSLQAACRGERLRRGAGEVDQEQEA